MYSLSRLLLVGWCAALTSLYSNRAAPVPPHANVVRWGAGHLPADWTPYRAVSEAYTRAAAVRWDGSVEWFGLPPDDEQFIRALTDVVDVVVTTEGGVARHADGRISPWGLFATQVEDQLSMPFDPATNVVALAAGGYHALALLANGRVMCAGQNIDGSCWPPREATNLVQIAAAHLTSVGLRSDGRLVGWGRSAWGIRDFPADLTNVVEVAASGDRVFARTSDGRVRVFGEGHSGGRWEEGLQDAIALASGNGACVALRANGQVWAIAGATPPDWIRGATGVFGQHLSGAAFITGPILADADGVPLSGEIFLPVGTNVVLLAAYPPEVPATFVWKRDGVVIPGETGPRLEFLSTVALGGHYEVTVIEGAEERVSQSAELVVGIPRWRQEPVDESGESGGELELVGEAQSSDSLSYEWLIDGEPLAEWNARVGAFPSLPEATQPTLQLTATTPLMSGGYQLVARTAYGSITSRVATVSISQAPLTDVSQPVPGGMFRLHVDGVRYEVAQTFIAGVSGKLARMTLQADGTPPGFPVLVRLTDVLDGQPGTNLLAQVAVADLESTGVVSFADADVYLTAGQSYAVAIFSECPPSAMSYFSVATSAEDVYSAGELWRRELPSGPWVPVDLGLESTVDLLFSAAVFPGIPDLRFHHPRHALVVAVNEPLWLEAVGGPGLPAGTAVEFRANGTLLARMEAPPYRFLWTPSAPGNVELTAAGGSAAAEARQVTVVATRPPNDDLRNAVAVSGENPSVEFSLAGASREWGEPALSPEARGTTLWWQWTAPRSGTVAFQIESADAAALAGFQVGSQLESLVAMVPAGREGQFAVEEGVTYRIAIDSASEIPAPGSLGWALNDLEISTPRPGATVTLPAALSLTATRTALARTLTQIEVLVDDVVVVVTNAVPADLVLPLAESGPHRLQLRATDAAGLVTYSSVVSVIVRPVNDRFIDAIEVVGYQASFTTSNAGASTESGRSGPGQPRGEPLYGDNQGGHSLWYRWTAPADGICRMQGEGLPQGLLLGGYVGTSVRGLAEVGVNAFNGPNSPAYFQAIQGRTYYLLVDGLFGEEGPLHWTLNLLPMNDVFATRKLITTPNYAEFIDPWGATLEDREHEWAPDGATGSWWWTWKAEQSGKVTVWATSDGSPVSVGIFSGGKLRLLTPVGGSGALQAESQATFVAEAGETYQLALFAGEPRSGRVKFELALSSVELLSPGPGSTWPRTQPIPLVARFSIPGEELEQLGFLANGVEVASPGPGSLTAGWLPPQAGNYQVQARARARSGATYLSPPVRLFAYDGEDVPAPRLISNGDFDGTLVLDATGTLHLLGIPGGVFGLVDTPPAGVPTTALWPPGVTRWESIGINANEFDRTIGWLGALAPDGRIYRNGTTPDPLPEGVQGFVRLCPGWFQTVAIGDNGHAYAQGSVDLHLPESETWLEVFVGYDFLAALDESGLLRLFRRSHEGFEVIGRVAHPQDGDRWVRMKAGSQFVILQDTQRRLYGIDQVGGWHPDLQPALILRPDGGAVWHDFSVGMLHVLALTEDGRLFAWGRNWEGQLGTGKGAGDYSLLQEVIQPAGVTAWIAFTAGRVHSMAIGNDGALYGWGWNQGGLGLPSSGALFEPVRVTSLEGLTGSPILFSRTPAEELPDGRFRLAFPTLLNRRYSVQYTDDLSQWKTAAGQILGTGGAVEWIDDGPPVTESVPGTGTTRLYRVVFAP